ncbi:MAG: FtsW/RodA/SpoVE family cell cycle protein [Lachnospiraceae bacterium]|nr:FtsW/RodA/SpoVE family cell cycle protein [Lachnospiraceae bacterium]
MNAYLEIYITGLSRYLLGIYLVIFVIFGIITLFRDDDYYNNAVLYSGQNVCMFLFHFTAFLSMCFHTGDMKLMGFYVASQLLMIGIIVVARILYPYTDKLFTNNMCMLMSIGFVILTRLNYNKALKEFFIITISMMLSMGVPFIIRRFKHLHTFKWIYASIGIAILGTVLIAGTVTYGANISYSLGGITFQPSEIVKIVFVFFVAAGFVRARGIGEVLVTASIALVHILILVLSRDLGSALIFGVVYVIMVYVATGNFAYVAISGVVGVVGAAFAYKLFTHVQVRIMAWRDPWSTIDNTGYQITQSLFALSSGSTWGVGLMKGNPLKIPFVEDDFVFSAIVEEMGFVTGIALLGICLISFVRALIMAAGLRSMFYRLLAVGLASAYIFQVFLTVGGGVKFIPLTGVTLPFVSYGGSSALASILLFEVLAGVSLIAGDERDYYEKIDEKDSEDTEESE